MTRFGEIGHSVLMVVVALTASLVLYQVAGYPAGEVLSGVVQGAVTAPGALTATVRWTIPLFLIALGVLVSFRAGYFNVGAQGQAYIGAIAAYTVTHFLTAPPAIVIVVALLASAIGGALWALIAAALKEWCNTDETLVTLMLNYVGILVLQYFAAGPYKSQAGSGQVAASPQLPAELRLSTGSGLSVTLVAIAVAAGLLTWLLMTRTRFGLVASLAGKNPDMVRWQGGQGAAIPMLAFGYGGALAGLAGAVEIMGPTGRLVAGFSAETGFTAILVAMVGLLTVPGAVVAALFFGALQAAVQYLPLVSSLPPSALPMLQGTIAILITAHFGMKWGVLRPFGRAKKPPAPEPVVPDTAAGVEDAPLDVPSERSAES